MPVLRGALGGLLLLLSSVVSCQSEVQLVVTPEVAELLPVAQQALGIGVSLEDPRRPDGNTLRLTTTPGWNLPLGSAPNGVFAASTDLAQLWPLSASFTALGRRADGWSAIPILFDLWGVTTFGDSLGSASRSWIEWKDLAKQPAPVRISGGLPSFRQAAFFLGADWPPSVSPEAALWFSQPKGPWVAALSSVPALVQNPLWPDNSWALTRTDFESAYAPGSPGLFVETYRSFEAANPPGTRRFVPLAAGQPGHPRFAGRVVFVEYRGTDLGQAEVLVQKLLHSGFVKTSGKTTKWLAASMTAPDVDGTGAHLRQLLDRVATLVPVTDRTPGEPNADELLGALQLSIESTPRR